MVAVISMVVQYAATSADMKSAATALQSSVSGCSRDLYGREIGHSPQK